MLMKLYNAILPKQMLLRNKVQKVITLRSIFAFFNNTTTYQKSNEKQKAFIDDLVLVVVKGLLPLNMIENLWMR
jgi:hypothetical protein